MAAPLFGNSGSFERDYYHVLIVGAPGAGKSSSLNKLDVKTTGFINAECKPLPFRNQFEHIVRTPSWDSFLQAYDLFAKDPEIKLIVVDSISKAFDWLLLKASAEKKGFDIYSMYNLEIGKFFQKMNMTEKEVIITAHYEILNVEGVTERRTKVKGKEWEGVIEKEFTIVLFADKEGKDPLKPAIYRFWLNKPLTTAKCPPDIFPGKTSLPNDMAPIIATLVEYATPKGNS